MKTGVRYLVEVAMEKSSMAKNSKFDTIVFTACQCPGESKNALVKEEYEYEKGSKQ